ncbi:MAG: hypothetical protein OXE94_07600 [Aestuariivita sp.]|nr:hypothetical protein [Aestuariivita sp.]MCY4202245.1 hypothetical protein [Aestuariivita sp.]MCY4287425.1 hypothetical protein [Aestuariivita sp.]MCY4347259.1 hypothetical protein [Aestuariivita sp.]
MTYRTNAFKVGVAGVYFGGFALDPRIEQLPIPTFLVSRDAGWDGVCASAKKGLIGCF